VTGWRQTAVLLGAIAVVLGIISGIAILGNTRPGARADLLSPRRAEPGELVEFRVSVRDTEGAVGAVAIDFGDGNVEHLEITAAPECGGPTTQDFEVAHTYNRAGVFTARATVRTGGCGASSETAEAVRTVSVRPLRS
jgi:hypothetical protein